MSGNSKKFVYYPLRKPSLIQPDCPVYIYAYSLAVEKDAGTAFAQVRLVNRSDKCVHSVFLQIEGLDRSGNSLYELKYIPIVECMGQPHETCGEEQPLFLPQGEVYSLNIQVLDVLFTDGMIWRRQNNHQMLTAEEAGWLTCTCGMKNPGEAGICAFCGKSLKTAESAHPLPPVAVNKEPEKVTEKEPERELEIPPEKESEEVDEDTAEVAPLQESLPEISEESGEDATEELLAELIADVPILTREAPPPIAEEILPATVQEPVTEDIPEDVSETPLAPEDTVQEEEIPVFADEFLAVESEEEDTAAEELHTPEENLSDDELFFESLRGDAPVVTPIEGESLRSADELFREEPSSPEEKISDQEEVPEEDSGNPFMQETERMLREFRRRMEAQKQGQIVPVEKPQEETESQETAPAKTEKGSPVRGVMFWVLMVILLIVLGAAAFFGVLYFKGYFG